MFSSNFKLSGIEDILGDIGYLSEEAEEGDEKAGEDQEHKYPKKSGKKSKDYDKDGTVEDETDEYAGVKDKAIEKAVEKEDEDDEDKKEKKTKKESVDFSSVLDELTDEDVLFLSDELIEEVVEEFFYETLEEGYEIEELETLLVEHIESELTILNEATVTVGHDSDVKPEASRTSKLAKVKDAVKKVASGAKAVAKKVAGAAGEVAGSAVAGYKKASASAQDSSGGSSSNTTSGGSTTSSSPKATGTKRPGLLGRVAGALKSGLKKAIHGTAKAAGKVVKTAKAGYDEGRGKTATTSAPAAKPVAKPAAKPVAKTATKKKGGNLDNLLNNIRNEEVELDEAIDPKGSRRIQAAIDKNKKPETQDQKDKRLMMGKYSPDKLYAEEIEIYDDLIEDMLSEGYDEDQIIEVIIAMEEGYEVIFEEDGAFIKDGVEQLDEEFLSDVELVADWLHMEGIIQNEDEYFELMEELSEEEIEELYELVLEATAMSKRGYDEAPIRNKIAANTKGGKSADRAKALADRPTYGDNNAAKQRSDYARKQMGDHRNTNSSNPGLKGYAHKSNDPAVKAKQAARGAQRGKATLTPNEKKQLNMGYEMIGDSLDNGGLEVRNYSWREVMEAQEARNNPEKYEREQKKNTSKSAMPPRGDKRREDFEKWYAANVR